LRDSHHEARRRGLLDNQGFTLLEALIAITLLALMMLALYRSAAMIMTRNVENTLNDEAVKVANEVIEDLRNQGFSSLSSGTETITRRVRGFTQTFTVEKTVINFSTAARVTVTVRWTYGGKSHSYSMVTVIADHG